MTLVSSFIDEIQKWKHSKGIQIFTFCLEQVNHLFDLKDVQISIKIDTR